MKLPVVIFSIAITFANAADSPLQLWPSKAEDSLHSDHIRKLVAESDFEQSRMAGVPHAHFFSAGREIVDRIQENIDVEFGIPLPDGRLEQKTCKLRRGNPIVPVKLAMKFPELKLFHCTTEDRGELRLVIDSRRRDGLSGSFFDGIRRRSFYVDNVLKDSEHFVIYDSEIGAREGAVPEFSDIVETVFPDLKFKFTDRNLLEDGFPAFKFKLAPLANRQYSAFHGNTKASVLAAIIECFSRVNGIYMREMGVFFVLIEDADVGICLNGDSRPACADVSNGSSVIRVSGRILSQLGITTDMYDIGHVLTTGSGGVAYLGSLCDNNNKAGGTTGLPEPLTDVYFVDYVAHEIGHQLYGGHVFRDCGGRFDSNFMSMSAAEPGSGSSIMGYAGICGSNNVQTFSDPYFNNVNLQQMRDFVAQRGNNGCGEKVVIDNDLPDIGVSSVCQVPVGNFFQLGGSSFNKPEGETSFFSWDRADLGYEDFDSPTLGSFRSWKPTTSAKRYFPNLYSLTYPTEYLQKVEKLPTIEREMSFRFTERRLYDTQAIAENFLESIIGDFSYADMTVEFTSTPTLSLDFPEESFSVSVGTPFEVLWSGGSNGLSVEVLVAENILEETNEFFDYERDVKELNWEVVGKASSAAGEATVTIPSSYNGKEISLMIRSSFDDDVESCFFFDVATKIEAVGPSKFVSSGTLGGSILVLIGTMFLFAAVFSALREKHKLKKAANEEPEFTTEHFNGSKGQVATKNPMMLQSAGDII